MVKLQICHMIPGFFPIAKGGAELFALNLCKSLALKGIRVQILTRNLNLAREEIVKGVLVNRFTNHLPYKIKYYGFGRFLRSNFIRILVAFVDILGATRTLLKIQRKNKYHLLHASFILPFGLIGLIVKKLFKIPLIITVHGPADFYEVPRLINPILRFVLKRADAVVAVSPKLFRDLKQRLGTLQVNLILNGIPLNSFKSTKKIMQLEKYGIRPDDFVILTAGRLVRRKNLKILIRTFPDIKKKIPNSKIILLGSGIEKENLKNLIEDLHLSSSIIMPGWVSEEEKVKIFKRADVFIQLSQIEGLSLALLESKAAGIPAIVIGSGESVDPVSPKITGLLIPPPITPEKILEKLLLLYQDTNLRIQIGKNVEKEANQHYSLQNMVENYKRLYLRVFKKYR